MFIVHSGIPNAYIRRCTCCKSTMSVVGIPEHGVEENILTEKGRGNGGNEGDCIGRN